MATIINGISYNVGDPFVCAKSANGNGNEAGTSNTSIALTVGKTYYFYGTGNYTVYPYLVHDGSNYIGWYKAEVFPVATYTVYYNANGGSNAPGSQTKAYDTVLTLSSTKPTRSGYVFQGWATSSNGNVAYQPGATYSKNANITLYAIWVQSTSYNEYSTYIYNGTSWDLYVPYIYNGAAWESYMPYIS